MRQIVQVLHSALFCLALMSASVAAQDVPSAKYTASLAEFGAKVQALEDTVGAIAFAGALALLAEKSQEWAFDRESGFNGLNSRFTNDVGAVAGDYEYSLSKVRGAIFRNQTLS